MIKQNYNIPELKKAIKFLKDWKNKPRARTVRLQSIKFNKDTWIVFDYIEGKKDFAYILKL